MKKIVSYKIIPDLSLIIEVFAGTISIADAIDLKRKEIEDKDYNAKWYVKYRFKRAKGVDSLFTYFSPFKGNNPDNLIENQEDEEDLMPSGLEWYVEFNKNIFT